MAAKSKLTPGTLVPARFRDYPEEEQPAYRIGAHGPPRWAARNSCRSSCPASWSKHRPVCWRPLVASLVSPVWVCAGALAAVVGWLGGLIVRHSRARIAVYDRPYQAPAGWDE